MHFFFILYLCFPIYDLSNERKSLYTIISYHNDEDDVVPAISHSESSQGEKEYTVDETELEGEDESEEYPTLSSPLKYGIFLVFFIVLPVGAGVYFYGGGKEKLRRLRSNSKSKGKGGIYEKIESERV
ncbi:uncharacterized protein L201_005498 [Kwoniella dendrophila CBS 6074]|uniref:Uncharacterized protein n=1 Tax=Kwoniella dendrophila CBS 6074 TaxID=1295534 RepID=A0AAX4JZ61_9TREE